jgi:hypothetical protein
LGNDGATRARFLDAFRSTRNHSTRKRESRQSPNMADD